MQRSNHPYRMQMVRTPHRSGSLPLLAATKKSFFAPLPETKKDIFRGTTLFGICLSIKQYICPLDSLNGGIPANPTVHSDWQLQGQFICIPQLPCTNRQLSGCIQPTTLPFPRFSDMQLEPYYKQKQQHCQPKKYLLKSQCHCLSVQHHMLLYVYVFLHQSFLNQLSK